MQNRLERSGVASDQNVLEFIRNGLQQIKRITDDESVADADAKASRKHLDDIQRNLTRLNPVITTNVFFIIPKKFKTRV